MTRTGTTNNTKQLAEVMTHIAYIRDDIKDIKDSLKSFQKINKNQDETLINLCTFREEHIKYHDKRLEKKHKEFDKTMKKYSLIISLIAVMATIINIAMS